MQVFQFTAAGYDDARRKLIPCFDDFYGTAVALLPEDTASVVDLGAGTGLLSAVVRERFPAASLHMIDSSEAMLAQARQRFHRDTNVTFALGDYTKVLLPSSPCDAVVSALSIHHLSHGNKRALFRAVLGCLKPGGVFVNAEQILQNTPQREDAARIDWLLAVHALGATAGQVAASILRQHEDRCATVGDQLQWLRDAGFTNAACAFEHGRFAVLHATA